MADGSPTPAPAAIPSVLTPDDADRIPWTHTTRRFRALGHDFAVRTTHAGLGRFLDEMYAGCAVRGKPHTRTHTWYSVVDGITDGPPHALYVDSERVAQSDRPAHVLNYLTWHVNQQVIQRSGDYVLLHAAAAARDGVGVVLPATMEAGKTTLVAGLLLAGFAYLTDEAAAIDPATLDVVPYPKPLSVDVGSRQVLARLEPSVDPSTAPYLADQWQVPPQRVRPDVVSDPVPASVVVFPRYEAGTRTSLEPIGRAQALPALVQQTFRFHRRGRHNFEVLGRVARQSRCFDLTVGDLDEACDLLGRLVDEEVAVQAAAGGEG